MQKEFRAKLKKYMKDESKFYSVGSGKPLKTFLEEKRCFCEINLMAVTLEAVTVVLHHL